jgi:hypothetical protein
MTPRILRLGLTSLCIGLAAVIAGEIYFALPDYGTQAAEPERNAAARIGILAPPNIDADVAEILERPLFSQNRAASPAASAEETDEGKGPQQLQRRLSGVMISPDGREALFQHDGEKPVAVKLGGQIDGWTVASVEPDHVVLKSGIGQLIVNLANGAGASRPAPRAQARNPNAAKTAVAAAANQAQRPAPAARPGGRQGQK